MVVCPLPYLKKLSSAGQNLSQNQQLLQEIIVKSTKNASKLDYLVQLQW